MNTDHNKNSMKKLIETGIRAKSVHLELQQQKTKLLQMKKEEFLKNETNFYKYTCPVKCLTTNDILSNDRFEEDELSIIISRSRNELKFKMSRLFKEFDGKTKMCIQLNGLAGTGKSYGLADLVITEKIKNFEKKNKIIVYYHFNEKSNYYCLGAFIKELFCSSFHILEKEFEKTKSEFNSPDKKMPEENSLIDLFRQALYKKTSKQVKIDSIEKIFSKLKKDYNQEIIVVFDQLNEISKGVHRNCSELLFNALDGFREQFIFVLCSSNNNEKSRNNIINFEKKEDEDFYM